jgi:hypothetical protein
LRLCSRAPRTEMYFCVKDLPAQNAQPGHARPPPPMVARPYLRPDDGILKAGKRVTPS